jgi:hypothetical protein
MELRAYEVGRIIEPDLISSHCADGNKLPIIGI